MVNFETMFILNLYWCKKMQEKLTCKSNFLIKEVEIDYLFCLNIIRNNVISLVR